MNVYVKSFINSFSSECLLRIFNRYNNACKEITESWGVFETAKAVIDNLDNYKVIVVGDGSSPRTAAIFAYFSKAYCHSIDPNLNIKHFMEHAQIQNRCGFPVKRLVLWKDTVENLKFDCEGRPLLVVWPHSHAPMNGLEATNYESRIDIAMPCCRPIPPKFLNRPHTTLRDENILSPHNLIYVWKD